MIVPSIDLMNGQTVQLVGGEKHALDAGDPIPIAEKFRVAGEIAVIDLDAAIGSGSNDDLVRRVCRIAAARVGGGIRTEQRAREWLDAGAARIILGTAATPELLSRLPRERVIAALDARDGEVVVEGWRKGTGARIIDRMVELRDHVSGFLVTFVEREGRLGGTSMELVPELIAAAGKARVTIAGGVTTAGEIAQLDRLGADAQVGMALYTGKLSLADAISAPLLSDRPDGLFPTVVCDERGVALGLAYSSRESIARAVETRRGVYHSRKRGIWAKGEGSGATQELLSIDLDCDRDAIRFTVRQHGAGFCHEGTRTCWGADHGLGPLSRLLETRIQSAPAGSYTARLLNDANLLRSKLIEEAGELADAVYKEDVCHEAADVLYFTLVAMIRAGVPLYEVEEEMTRKSRKVSRRPGDAKP